jgi:hypothetical protein
MIFLSLISTFAIYIITNFVASFSYGTYSDCWGGAVKGKGDVPNNTLSSTGTSTRMPYQQGEDNKSYCSLQRSTRGQNNREYSIILRQLCVDGGSHTVK